MFVPYQSQVRFDCRDKKGVADAIEVICAVGTGTLPSHIQEAVDEVIDQDRENQRKKKGNADRLAQHARANYLYDNDWEYQRTFKGTALVKALKRYA